MPVYIIGAPKVNPRTQQVQLLQPGMVWRWVVSAPNVKLAKQLSYRFNLGVQEHTQFGIHYITEMLKDSGPPMLLAVEKMIPVQISKDQVQQGQQVPQGNRAPNQQMDGVRDVSSGFEELGGASLDASADNMYGQPSDGTWTDMICGPGGGAQEVRRG